MPSSAELQVARQAHRLVDRERDQRAARRAPASASRLDAERAHAHAELLAAARRPDSSSRRRLSSSQGWLARLAARAASRLVRLTVHGLAGAARDSSVRSSADSRRMSATSCASSGKSISTQPTTSGAFTGTSTDLVRPAGEQGDDARLAATPPLAPPAARPAGKQIARCRCAVVARRLKSVASRATSVAPMRAPWLASTETMVSASFELTASRKP